VSLAIGWYAPGSNGPFLQAKRSTALRTFYFCALPIRTRSDIGLRFGLFLRLREMKPRRATIASFLAER
jgi:hypothetical protein